MRLVQLIYASAFAENLDPAELSKIKATAESTNGSLGISGMLVAGNDRFLQCLEGGREAVNRLYSKIVKDPRHREIFLLDYREVPHRDFDRWSMGFILLTKAKSEIVLRYSLRDEFDPFKMSAAGAHGLLLELKKSLP